MTALEKTIFNAALGAARTYSKMTGGSWLSEGPEVFLQTEVARAIWQADKKGRKVFIDLPNKRISEWLESKISLPREARQRPDIFIVNKSWDPIAAIEVKTKGNFTGVLKDAAKVKKSFKRTGHPKVGYLLVYFEGGKCLKQGEEKQKRETAQKYVRDQFLLQLKKLRKSDRHWSCAAKKVGDTYVYSEEELLKFSDKRQRNWYRGSGFAWAIGLYRLRVAGT